MTSKPSASIVFSTSTIIFFLVLFCMPVFAQSQGRGRNNENMSFLADSAILTKSDYLSRLQKVFEVVNKVPVTMASFTKLEPIAGHLTQDEAALALIKKRLSQNNRGLNLQNVQMYQTLLNELESNNRVCLRDLQEYEATLNELKTEILNLRKDTVLIRIFRTDSLRAVFKDQFVELKKKRTVMDSMIKGNTLSINNLQARTTSNLISIKELIYMTDAQLKSVSIKAFGKERRYLWESVNVAANESVGFKRFINGEKQISQYYFIYTRSSRFLLLFMGVVFFFWVFLNFRSLKELNQVNALNNFNFTLLSAKPFLISLILIFSLAPVFDLRAPALYIEFVHILMVICLSLFFYKKISRKLFYKWCVFALLICAPVILRILGMPPRFQRWLLLLLSMGSSCYGILVLKSVSAKAKSYKFLPVVGIIYIVFSITAIFCNLFGRFTLTQIFYTTGVTALLHAISLTIVARMILEAFLLQMKSSRVRKNYPEYFDWAPVISRIKRQVGIVAIVIWFVLFATNLNVLDEFYTALMAVLTEKRTIGSFSFTLGGIVLFLGIIWTANFLQKYIAYFFGDTGEDSLDDNKGERSKLLVTRLVLLIGGFLVAVAASGLPIDKITVILGALGVGIGLGLQNIVSNFVSGIILIFDRTIRIGDVVELSNKKGRVKEIGVRASTLLSDEGAEIIIPNGAILSNNIINWTLSNNLMRIDMELSIAKPFNAEEVMSWIKEVITANTNVYHNKEPKVIISPVNKLNSIVKIYFWCNDVLLAENTRSLINAQIFDVLEEKGIEIL